VPPARHAPWPVPLAGRRRAVRDALPRPLREARLPDSSDIYLDPAEAERAKRRRQYRLNVVDYPAARVVGNALLLVAVALHNRFILGELDLARFTRFAVALTLYSLLSWLVLVLFWPRVRRVDLGDVFMAADIVAWTFAIYVSGGERSWLFFLMIMRAADQRLGSVRRVLVFGHLSVLAYAAMIAYIAGVEHHRIAPAAEIAKLVILYSANLYLAATALTADSVRRKLVASIRVAREMLARRDEAVESLRDNAESYRTLFETVSDPIMTASLDGTITGVNRALEQMSGYTRDELIGRHYSMLTTTAVVQSSEERKRRAMAGEEVGTAEVVAILKNGEHVPFEVRSALIRDRAGRPTGAVGVYRDIRQHKKTQEALERARELAEDASGAKSALLAAMSHELRTPLNSIIGFTRLLLRGGDGPLTERQESYVRSVELSSTHLLELITSVLDLSHVEAGKQELTIDEVDVTALVDECLQAAHPFVTGKRVVLERDIPPGLPPLFADRLKVRQILLNLITNAARFTPAGRVLVSARVEAEFLRLSVADTGIGIAESQLPLVFEPFYRPPAPSTREMAGSGLGLALTKRFVELHGGQIAIESREGHGSTVHVRLPLAPRT
jgi:PAS domain S-box-containing protein